MAFKQDEIFKVIISVLLSLIVFFCGLIRSEQADINCRLRAVELQNARMMERLGIETIAKTVAKEP